MTIMEALQADPRARDIFEGHGIDCVGCSGISLESIEDGARMLKIDLEAMLAELNQLAPIGLSGQE
jgi:hybrid cluster-associated redox disulfide protein